MIRWLSNGEGPLRVQHYKPSVVGGGGRLRNKDLAGGRRRNDGFRDESFIISWGAGYIKGGGVGNVFGDVLGGGLKIK